MVYCYGWGGYELMNYLQVDCLQSGGVVFASPSIYLINSRNELVGAIETSCNYPIESCENAIEAIERHLADEDAPAAKYDYVDSEAKVVGTCGLHTIWSYYENGTLGIKGDSEGWYSSGRSLWITPNDNWLYVYDAESNYLTSRKADEDEYKDYVDPEGDYTFKCSDVKRIVIEDCVAHADFAYFENVDTIVFKDHAPADPLDCSYSFEPVAITACYPSGDATWTDEAKAAIGAEADITWIPVEFDQSGGFQIVRDYDISHAEVAPVDEWADVWSCKYWASPITPSPRLTVNGEELVEGTDYTLAHENNTNVGYATIVIAGRGEFEGFVEVGFRIVEARWTRLSGRGRYDTSAKVAEWEISQGMGVANVAVATGANFPDALAGAALCGKSASVLVLVSLQDASAIEAALSGNRPSQVETGYVIGGTGSVPASVMDRCMHLTS